MATTKASNFDVGSRVYIKGQEELGPFFQAHQLKTCCHIIQIQRKWNFRKQKQLDKPIVLTPRKFSGPATLVKFVGNIPYGPGEWVGLELDKATNGSVFDKVRIWACHNH